MPSFSYVGRNHAGELTQGVIEADALASVAQQLMNNGITPIKISPKLEKKAFSFPEVNFFSAKITDEAFLMFCRQMHSLISAGVPILDAVSRLAEVIPNPYFSGILTKLGKKLAAGESLSHAMEKHPKVFSFLLISLVAAGEANGRLDQSFLQASKHYELEITTRRRVKTALRYPMFVILTIAVAVVIINIFVIPRFATLYTHFGASLPLPTRILIGTSNFMRNDWGFLLIILAALWAAYHYFMQQEKIRAWQDRYKLKVPVFGELLQQLTMANFSSSLSMLLQTGVPLIQALSLTANILDNSYAKEKVLKMRSQIERGESLSKAASDAKIFSPLILQMISVGEETGNIDKMLLEVSKFYEQEIDYKIKQLTQRLEPLLLFAVGALVLMLALGVFLPMWDMVYVVK